jgi:hypothetical protein
MKKFVIFLFIFFTAFVSQAVQDSTAVAVKNADTRPHEKNSIDSTNANPARASADSVKSKVEAAKVSIQPDSLQKFVDKNGDGFNDNAPDHDGDGIPDALDKDYWALMEKNKSKPEDGAPPKVLGLDALPAKILPKGTSEPDKSKPGIKFNIRGGRGGK